MMSEPRQRAGALRAEAIDARLTRPHSRRGMPGAQRPDGQTDLLGIAVVTGIPSDVRSSFAAILDIEGWDIELAPRLSAAVFPLGDRTITILPDGWATPALRASRQKSHDGIAAIALRVGDVDALSETLESASTAVLRDRPALVRSPRPAGVPSRRSQALPFGPNGPLVELLREAAGPAATSTVLTEVVYATHDVQATAQRLADLFALEVGPEIVQSRPPESITFRNVHAGDHPIFGIIGAIGGDSPVADFLAHRGDSVYSVVLRVPDLAARSRRIEDAGLRMVLNEPSTVLNTRSGRRAIPRADINWVRPGAATGRVLFELQEYPESHAAGSSS